METVVLLVLSLVVLVLFLIYRHGTRTHGTLEKLGIPVIKPYPFVGSYLTPWTKYTAVEDQRNAKRFGAVWGQYDGLVPYVYVASVELAKCVMIKDFEYFQDRPVSMMDYEYARDMLDFLKGEQWKQVRSLFSKTVSSGSKLKAMMTTVKKCTEDGFKRLDAKLEKENELVIQDELFGPIVLDAMSQFSFGIKIPMEDKSNPFLQHVNIFTAGDYETPAWKAAFRLIFKPGSEFEMIVPAFKFMNEVMRKSIKERRISGGSKGDIVDIMVDAIDNKVPTKEFRDLNITEDIIVTQGAELLMASYGTTAAVLSFCTYYLVRYPDIMERVVCEVEDEEELTYESAQRLPLLEAVMYEALRLTPFIPRHIRTCTRDWERDGVRIPAGTNVVISASTLQMDPGEFPEPESFQPDRWLADGGRKLGQYHWMPFGLGPRACLGTRLATLEVKYILASFLKRYRVSTCSKSRLEVKPGLSLLADFYSIWIKVEKR
ncbi:cytochrome P450 3A41-like [Amphibalanus amphitrite]|uniref:cytochrome P450 3A41-like n=1 Tax=Amphibalanus amphitrite TaxID=1232801 RepID=UPI001C92B494|nr:cytochrome P450 3A41-like [Amphibalanus amphitrite]